MPQAFAAEFEPLVEAHVRPEDSENERDERELEVPVNEIERWKKLARARNLRALHAIGDSQFAWANLLWLVLAAPVMRIHWDLFKHSTFHGLMSPEEESKHKDLVAQFCCADSNPAQQVVKELVQMLCNPDIHFKLLKPRFGSFQNWGQERKSITRRALLIVLGQLFRKLIHPFLGYPWKLCPLGGADERQRKSCAEELLRAKDCCLDAGFSRKLRLCFPSLESLLADDSRLYFKSIFSRVVATSTFIERRFAHYSRWCSDKGKKPTYRGLASKHVTSMHKELVAKWRRNSKAKVEKHVSRPVWMQKGKNRQASSRLTGFHMFVKEQKQDRLREGRPIQGAHGSKDFLKECSEKWRRLSDEDKRPYSIQARGENTLRRAASDEIAEQVATCGGPWGMADLDGQWPIKSDVLEPHLLRKGWFKKTVRDSSEARWWNKKITTIQG